MSISTEMLSPYLKQLIEELNLKTGNVQKLVPNLQDKQKYVLHHRNLKLYLQLGMKLIKIHRVFLFQQRPWLTPYIDFNTATRAQAKNAFEKNVFKLMNNAVSGKTMENVREHINVVLVTSQSSSRSW